MQSHPTVPFGLCHCGCGQKTALAKRTYSKQGVFKGQPLRFLPHHQRLKSPVEYIKEDRGHDTPCWVWQRATSTEGYGKLRVDGVLKNAHRVIYERHRGEIPAGLELDHLCRIPACVNPDHLEPVTHAENDRRGSRAKLTRGDVRVIRASSESNSELGRRFGVSHEAIRQIRLGNTWRDV